VKIVLAIAVAIASSIAAPALADTGSGSAAVPAATTSAPKSASPTVKPAAPNKDVKPVEEKKTKANTVLAIKIIGGLIALLVLAYLGGNRRVVRFQEQLGIGGVITAGFPFVALGLIASLPSIGILSGDVLAGLRPVLHFGLGWLGFIIGAQLDIRVLDRVPKGTAYLILVEALGPFAITAAGCGFVMITWGLSWRDTSTWRDLVLLGSAAAMTAPRKFRGFANRTWHEGRGADVLLGQLDELVGVIGLLFITAYFRESTSPTWQLPDTAWIFISLGLGVAVGTLIFAMIRVPATDPEFLAIVLGGIAFASGLAGYLDLSPIVVCFLAGALVTNFPNDQRENMFRILGHLERPVQLLFLLVVGAVWNVTDWRGWALVPLFVLGRAIGKYSGFLAAKTAVGAFLPIGFAEKRSAFTPMSGLAIALVISILVETSDPTLPWLVTAVVGGSLLTELILAKVKQPDQASEQTIDELDHGAPIDELQDLHSGGSEVDGPIYRDDPPPPPPKRGAP
jgi:Kef-type K+ transport system membrane component KefB